MSNFNYRNIEVVNVHDDDKNANKLNGYWVVTLGTPGSTSPFPSSFVADQLHQAATQGQVNANSRVLDCHSKSTLSGENLRPDILIGELKSLNEENVGDGTENCCSSVVVLSVLLQPKHYLLVISFMTFSYCM